MTPTPFPNQPPPYEGRNLFTGDASLGEALVREGGAHAQAQVSAWGETLGRSETYALADAANRNPPRLRTLDRTGQRIDDVEFHPAWHALMTMATAQGEHAAPWCDPRAGAQVARAAMYLLHAQVENGTQCPLTMTYAAVPALRAHADAALVARWLPKVLAFDYDARELPIADKRAALIGMGMTERQGGSDVRSNRTHAQRQADGTYRITGHKWFFSAPQCDAHLVLAQADGVTCFLVPRQLDDGSRNALRLLRLKDKLGNRSNASSEVEFDGALGHLVGEPGRGVATILEMVRHTRLDCVLGTAGMMRGALAWALHHATHRIAFGAALVDQPLMRNVLADLALEVEAATALSLRLARAFEAPPQDSDQALARVLTPAAKYWICKRGATVAAEAMEVLGGNGYVEENPLPRVYREMPVNSIWEGSGNVIALDVVRGLSREAAARDALHEHFKQAMGADARFDAAVRDVETLLSARLDDAGAARRIAQLMTLTAQAALLIRHAPGYVADAFCASRLSAERYAGAAFGTLPGAADAAAIVARARG